MNIPFFMLPDLLRDSLVPFLDLKSCVRLDSAVLIKNHRANWLEGLTLALLHDPRIEVEKDGLSWMEKRKLRLMHIVLTGNTSDSDVAEYGQEVLSELLTLRINSCQTITDIGVALMLQCCAKLIKLEFERCYQIYRFAFRELRPLCLRELNFFHCTDLDDPTFADLVVNCRNHCPELRKIVDAYVREPTANEDFDRSYSNILVELAQMCPLLEHLEVQAPFLADDQLSLFAQHCPHLHTFDIGINELIFGEGVKELVTKCPSLTHLNIMNLVNIREDVLELIAQHCKTLTKLHLPGEMEFNGELLCGIWCANPRLQTLVLDGYAPEDPVSFDVTSVAVSALTHLDIASTNLTESSLLTLFSKCPMLTHLDMSFTNNASSTPVMTCLGRFCPLLHTLLLTQCDDQDQPPPALSALAIHCTSLTTLRLAGTNATEEGLIAIIAKNSFLQTLDLSWCIQMSDVTSRARLLHFCHHGMHHPIGAAQ
eukprot:gene12366-14314_t